MKEENIKKKVREGYAKIAVAEGSCCGSSSPCGGDTATMSKGISKRIGYSEQEIESVPEGANLGLGCGNPIALASLKAGETVLDLGSGGGFDCFLAANRVGKNGKVIGVDMTPEMIDRARRNGQRGKYSNVEFRLGEIENLPVADNSVDVIISNCVINLAPDKKRVFNEAFRVLKPNGRLMVSDMVLLKKLPEAIKRNVQAYIGCLSGAEMKDKYLRTIEEVGFKDVTVRDESLMHSEDMANDPTAKAIAKSTKIRKKEIEDLASSVASIKVSAIKPK